MKHFNLEDLKTVVNKRGVNMRSVFSHDHATVKNLLLKPGDAIPPHQVPVDVFFYVIKGEGFITIDDEETPVRANDIVMCPPNTLISVRAGENSRLEFLNVKTPGIE